LLSCSRDFVLLREGCVVQPIATPSVIARPQL
jgi:hypothetical protein